jgi:hypothetical protein
MSTTSEEIRQLLQNLRLYKMATTLESELAVVRKSLPSYSDFLARLLRDQKEGRTLIATARLSAVSRAR